MAPCPSPSDLAVFGTHGDVLPFLAIGRALAQRGHEVALSAPAPFAAHAARAGLTFHPLGTREDYDAALSRPELHTPTKGIRLGLELGLAVAGETVRWIEREREAGEAIVVASFNCYGARIAQELFGLPTVTVQVMPFLVESRIASPRLPGLPVPDFLPARFRHWLSRGADRYVLDRIGLPGLNAYRASLGLPPVRRLRRWWNSPSRLLLAFPPWYAPPQLDWPLQALQVGFPLADRLGDAGELDDELARFLDAGEPPLVFSYGSGMRRAGAFFATAVDICRRMSRRGVLLSPQDGQVPSDLPPGIVRTAYAPLSLLLPRCAAIVHHGGIGTVSQALAAGIPQLVVPVMGNQFDEAERLRRLGVGASLGRRAFSARRASQALHRLLASPRVARHCSAARARMAQEDGVGAACDAIERMRPPAA